MKTLLLVMVLLWVGIVFVESYDEKICLEEATVVSIPKVSHRSAKFELDNGRYIWLSQSNLGVGDTICVKMKKHNKLFNTDKITHVRYD